MNEWRLIESTSTKNGASDSVREVSLWELEPVPNLFVFRVIQTGSALGETDTNGFTSWTSAEDFYKAVR